MKRLYPNATMLVILCDGDGSNSSRHRIVKQDLMDLSDRIAMRNLVMHYPSYCSKFNLIEHRLFSQITRSWSGTPLRGQRLPTHREHRDEKGVEGVR